MGKDIIQDIWDKGREEHKMTRAEIQAVLEPRIRKNAFSLRMWVWFYLMVLSATLILDSINIFGYWANPVMLSVQLAVTLISLGFLTYGIHVLRDFVRIDRADESLLVRLRRRLRFYQTKYEIWLWIVVGTVYLLQFAVNTMIDNQDGHYRINRPGFFVGISIVFVLFMYGVMKVAHYPFVKELQAILSDLENQITEATDKVALLRRSWRYWSILLAVVLAILFIWGLLEALNTVP